MVWACNPGTEEFGELSMSVLAHIVLNSDNVAPEPAATKAFAFILNSDHEAATRFVRRVCEELGLGPFELGRIAGQPHSDDGRPDLVIHDAEHLLTAT